jgi:hypothetical protein
MQEPTFRELETEVGLPWKPFCAVLHQRHPPEMLYCLDCGVGRTQSEIDSNSAVPIPSSPRSQSRTSLANVRVANQEREVVNARLRNTSARPNIGSSALSTRVQVTPRTTGTLNWIFLVALFKERFYYKSPEDEEDGIREQLSRKFIGK